MKFYPVTIAPRFLCFLFFAFMVIISCTKDNDLFESAVLDESSKTVVESSEEPAEADKEEAIAEEIVDEEEIIDPMVEKIFETRTTVFPVINDAHLQGGIGFNQNIVRLEEGRRTSYLMFDLSPIDSIGGTVNTTNLKFTIDSDDGSGTISVFKAVSNDWSEDELSAKTAPETESLIGEVATQFAVGQTHEVALDTALVDNEVLTLVLEHQEGNDLAFASKEHPSGKGPGLVVTYSAPQDAEAIVFDDAPEIELQGEDPTGPTTADTTDESTEENTKEELSGEEVTPDEETSSGETTEVESTDEETTNDETEDKETKEEETKEETTESGESTNDEIKEETIESEESTEEESQAEEKPTKEETTEEEVTKEETTEEEEEATKEAINNEADAPQNEAPNAVAEASPSSGDAPLKVNFKGNSSSDDLGVKNYIWDFRDGSTSTEANPTHTFEKTGTLEVRLTVTDDQGASDTDTVTITINEKEENMAPKAVATASPTSGEATLNVQFKGSSSNDDTEIKKYFWDFRDGSTSTEANPTHTFEKTGTFEVRLTVTDDQGASDTDTVTITINEKENRAPKAVATASPTSGEATLDVQFKGSSSNDDTEIKKYFWDFKDGSTATNSNPSHSFSKAGTYEVELSVTDEEGLTDTETVTIEVNETENQAPEAKASGSPLTGYAPLDVQFNASNSKDDNGVTGYFWDFKDGSTTTSKNPSHTFSEPGEYEVELSVKDEEGLTDTTTIKVRVDQRPVDNSDNGGDNGGGSDNNGGNDTGGGNGSGNSGSDNGGSSNSGNYPSNAVFASSFGFNSGDATAAFKAAINSGSSYVVIDKQSSDWVIQPTKFFNLRNMTIVFEPGVVLRAKSGAFGAQNAQLVNLATPDNLTIEGTGATFKMNKSEYNSGEFRHTLGISGGKNVTIKGLTLKDSGGDGIFISVSSSRGYSENITIDGVTCENNRRQGMTIVSGKDIFIKNSKFINTSGTKPSAGVDLESERTTDRLQNINFTNCEFSGNDSAGFHFSTVHVNSSSPAIDVTVRDSEFKNNGVSPSGGGTPTEIYLGGGRGTDPVNGEIRFERVKFNGSRGRIVFSRKSSKGFKAVFKDCVAKNVVTSSSSSPIRLEAHENRNTLGGIVFDNFYIEYSRNVPFMHINAPSKGGSFDFANVSGSFTIKEPNDNPLKYSGGYNPSSNQNVSINYNHN